MSNLKIWLVILIVFRFSLITMSQVQSFYSNDTIYHRTIKKFNLKNEIIADTGVSTHSNKSVINNKFTEEYIGDSIINTKHYKNCNNNWSLCFETQSTMQKNVNFTTTKTFVKTYSDLDKNIYKSHINNSKNYYAYDEFHNITTIYKEDLCDNENEICDKHYMLISYKKR